MVWVEPVNMRQVNTYPTGYSLDTLWSVRGFWQSHLQQCFLRNNSSPLSWKTMNKMLLNDTVFFKKKDQWLKPEGWTWVTFWHVWTGFSCLHGACCRRDTCAPSSGREHRCRVSSCAQSSWTWWSNTVDRRHTGTASPLCGPWCDSHTSLKTFEKHYSLGCQPISPFWSKGEFCFYVAAQYTFTIMYQQASMSTDERLIISFLANSIMYPIQPA